MNKGTNRENIKEGLSELKDGRVGRVKEIHQIVAG